LNASQPPPILLPSSTSGPSRLSLASPIAYTHQDGEPRVLNNAENYFKIKRNLHQGASVNPHAHTPAPQSFPGVSVGQYTSAANLFQGAAVNQYTPGSTLPHAGLRHSYTSTLDLQPTFNTTSRAVPQRAPQYSQASPVRNNESREFQLDQIVNGMMYGKQILQALPGGRSSNDWQPPPVSRLDTVQPQEQQVNPPFKLGILCSSFCNANTDLVQLVSKAP